MINNKKNHTTPQNNNNNNILRFVKLKTHYYFKLDIQKVDQHTGGKWLNLC